MRFESDFEDLIRCFNLHSVEFLLVELTHWRITEFRERLRISTFTFAPPRKMPDESFKLSSHLDSQAWMKKWQPLLERSS